MPKFKLKRGDTVEVIAGKNKGKRGQVREVRPDTQRIVVADVNIVKRHMKAGRSGARQAGIVEIEALSTSRTWRWSARRPTSRPGVGVRTLPDGLRVRFSERSGEQL